MLLLLALTCALPETPEQLFARLTKRAEAPLTAELLSAAVKDASPSVRYAAAAAFARAKKTDAFVAPLGALATDKDAETRAMATKALVKHGAPPDAFLPLLADGDWRVRAEAYRGALAKDAKPSPNTLAQVATVLTKAWVEASAKPGDAHPLLVALEAEWPFAKEPAVKALNEMIYAQSSSATDVDRRRMGCLAAYGRLSGGGGSLTELHGCADTELGAKLSAQAIEEGLGGADKLTVLTKLWKDPLERVRAAAAAAAVFSKIAPAIVTQALSAKETSLVAFAADAIARYARDAKKAPQPDWLALALKRLDDPALEVDAKLSLLDALAAAAYKPALAACQKRVNEPVLREQALACVTAIDPKQASSAPASQPVAAPLPFDVALAKGKTVDLRVVTARGAFTLRVDGKVAPYAAASLVHLAQKKLFDGTIFHRVVANFVVQGGDPSGTGTASAGYSLPAEPSAQPFSRGAVGIADSGPGTGGSQWFVMHSRAPHLEGRYTWVGTVTEGLDVIDRLQVGDRIESFTLK